MRDQKFANSKRINLTKLRILFKELILLNLSDFSLAYLFLKSKENKHYQAIFMFDNYSK